MSSLTEGVPLTSGHLSPDDVLEKMGSRSPMLLIIVVITGFSWASTSMTGMNAAFVTQNCGNCSEMISVVDEFDLRGDLTYQADMTTTAFMLGQMIGGTYLSQLGDKYGRRPIMLLSFVSMFIIGCLAALSPNIPVFCVLRFIQGAFYTAGALVAWVLGYECSPVKMRFFTSTLFGMMWVLGYCLLTPVAYFSPSWRWVTFATGVPHLLLFIACYFFTPESLHYLVSIDDRKKVAEWLEKAAKGKDEGVLAGIDPNDIVKSKEVQETPEHLLRQVWSHKRFLLYLSIFVYIWICDTFIYFGLSLYSTHLAGNIYLNYLLMGLVEIPAYILSPVGMNTVGRRFVVSWSHLLAAGAFVGLLFAPTGTLSLLLWLFGKLCISCSFMGIYVFASEVFPTDSRNLCLGFCEMMSRIGGILASQMGLLSRLHPNLPMIILSFISLFGGLLSLILPETRGKQLPSTIEESSRRKF